MAACISVPHLHLASLVLLLLLVTIILATLWGLREAVVAAILGTLLVGYCTLPQQRWPVEAVERWAVLITFLGVTTLSSYLAVLVKNQRDEAVSRRRELERLYEFGETFPIEGNPGSVLERSLNSLISTFQLDAAAYYDCDTGEITGAGPKAHAITRDLLSKTVRNSEFVADHSGGSFLISIRLAGKVIGSLGLRGGSISESTVRAIAERIEVGLEKISAYEAQRQAEDVRKVEELKSAMLDALIHEIKTPVSVIKTAASSLLSRDSDADLRIELLTVINEETDHLDDSISHAFWAARIEAGISWQGKAAHQVHRLISEVVSDLGPLIRGRSVKIEVPESLPPANFDFRMIKAVLAELLTNAVKYSPDESPLLMSAQQLGDDIIITVADSGPGISPHERDRIFEKHYRGAVKAPGTGLGLAFAKTIVEAHRGQIGVRNEAGSGSVFYFSLPISNGEAA